MKNPDYIQCRLETNRTEDSATYTTAWLPAFVKDKKITVGSRVSLEDDVERIWTVVKMSGRKSFQEAKDAERRHLSHREYSDI